ncbi:hypothetical protein [Novosphingobium sp.]|uniref:hypothetical protein n=1 Tax=Novosphingobium sp. TaxID=1874826 RepID=UPI00286EA8C9|nr:hypothetical protein [Novosphingobium sp.]
MAWLKRYFRDLLGAHVDGLRAIAGLPWLFALFIGWEFAQHVAEVQSGFFSSLEAAKAAQYDTTRSVLGWIKMIFVYVGGFFTIRYLVSQHGGTVVAPLGEAFRRYLPYIAYSLVLFALVFYAPQLVAKPQVMTLRAVAGLSQVFIEPLLIVWIVSAATSGAISGPAQSARVTTWLYFWALALFFVGRLPVNIAHQMLNKYARGESGPVLWAMLALDAVVVGLIIAVIPALYVRIARFIAERRDAA